MVVVVEELLLLLLLLLRRIMLFALHALARAVVKLKTSATPHEDELKEPVAKKLSGPDCEGLTNSSYCTTPLRTKYKV